MSPAHASPSGRRRSLWVLALGGALLVVAAAVAFALLNRASSGGASHAPTEEPGVVVETTVTRVSGPLPRDEREALRDEVRALVETYVESAYVDGGTDFPGFTGGARRLALEDADVTSGRGLASRGRVELRRGRSDVAVLSTTPDDVAGATAAVRLLLQVGEGEEVDEVAVTGRLLLTPTPDGWRVFGYDLAMADPSGEARADGSAR